MAGGPEPQPNEFEQSLTPPQDLSEVANTSDPGLIREEIVKNHIHAGNAERFIRVIDEVSDVLAHGLFCFHDTKFAEHLPAEMKDRFEGDFHRLGKTVVELVDRFFELSVKVGSALRKEIGSDVAKLMGGDVKEATHELLTIGSELFDLNREILLEQLNSDIQVLSQQKMGTEQAPHARVDIEESEAEGEWESTIFTPEDDFSDDEWSDVDEDVETVQHVFESKVRGLEEVHRRFTDLIKGFVIQADEQPKMIDLNESLLPLGSVYGAKLQFSEQMPNVLFQGIELQAALNEVGETFYSTIRTLRALISVHDERYSGNELSERWKKYLDFGRNHQEVAAAEYLMLREDTFKVSLGDDGTFTFLHKFPKPQLEWWRKVRAEMAEELLPVQTLMGLRGASISEPQISGSRGTVSVQLKLPGVFPVRDQESYELCKFLYQSRRGTESFNSKVLKTRRVCEYDPDTDLPSSDGNILEPHPERREYLAAFPGRALQDLYSRKALDELLARSDKVMSDLGTARTIHFDPHLMEVSRSDANGTRRLSFGETVDRMIIQIGGERSFEMTEGFFQEAFPIGRLPYILSVEHRIAEFNKQPPTKRHVGVAVAGYTPPYQDTLIDISALDMDNEPFIEWLCDLSAMVTPYVRFDDYTARALFNVEDYWALKARLLGAAVDLVNEIPTACGVPAEYCYLGPMSEVKLGVQTLFDQSFVARFWDKNGRLIAQGPMGPQYDGYHQVAPCVPQADSMLLQFKDVEEVKKRLEILQLTDKRLGDRELEAVLESFYLDFQPLELRMALVNMLDGKGRLYDSREHHCAPQATLRDLCMHPAFVSRWVNERLQFNYVSEVERIGKK